MNIPNRQLFATRVAIAFHLVGFIAIVLFKSSFFISLTPLNLIICTALIFWTQKKINSAFLLFCLAGFTIGFTAEYIGITTGKLFGSYAYGSSLGPKWNGVPWIIGAQWMVITYCIGICMHMLHVKLTTNQLSKKGDPQLKTKAIIHNSKKWIIISTLIDGAFLAVLFDWVMEPAAIKLGFWQWENGEIPKSNYYSWLFLSIPILAAFHFLPFKKQNIFAVHLLLIQFMFFLLINTFYK